MILKFSKNFALALLIILSASILFGCTEDDSAPVPTSRDSAQATIGTSNFVSSKLKASTESFFGQMMVNLDYTNQAGDSLKISVDGSMEKGESAIYEITTNSVTAEFILNFIKADGTEFIPSNGDEGELTITFHDKKAKIIKGTFSGNLKSFDSNQTPLNISNGSFEAKY